MLFIFLGESEKRRNSEHSETSEFVIKLRLGLVVSGERGKGKGESEK